MTTGDITGVESLLQLAEATLARSSPPLIIIDHEMFDHLPAQLSIQRAGLALLAGDVNGTIAHASRALDLTETTDYLRRGSATASAGPRTLDRRRSRHG